jgi:hypothetical protein
LPKGQKSGFYCDQRDNRKLLASYAKGQKGAWIAFAIPAALR